MKKMKQEHTFNMSTRVLVILGVMLLLVVLFLIRLLQLQVFGGDQFRQDAIVQRRRAVEIDPKRGSIYDRNQEPLALSVTVNTCYLFPKEVTDGEGTAALLSRIMNLEQSTIQDAISSGKSIVKLKTKLSQEEVDQIKNSGLRTVSVEQEDARYYPEGQLLSQTLGFLNDEGKGIYGIESSYNDELSGQSGQRVYSRDLSGNIIPYDVNTEVGSTAGNNLVLTIDKNMQSSVAKHLQNAYDKFKPDSISAIVMNPQTGEILSMDNFPSFDNNTPRTLVAEQEMARWNTMTEQERLDQLYTVWKNPIVSNTYEPGSVFKALTTAMALEQHSSKPSSTYVCNGTMKIADGVTIRCWRYWQPHGEQTLEEALLHSCNPAFVQIVREIGPEAFYSYAKSLRIGEKTGVTLPGETVGLFPATVDDVTDVRLATMSYGHGVSVTPLELISAANTVVNGGVYYEPYIVSKVVDSDNKVVSENHPNPLTQVFSAETSATMRTYLEDYVKIGGGTSIAIDGYRIGGKTGTTLKISNGTYDDNQTVASFWGVYPADHPKYSILVVLDNPKEASSGADAAGGALKGILEDIIESEKGAKIETQPTGLVEVPNLSGLTVVEAAQKLNEVGLKLTVYGNMGEYTVIDSQLPLASAVAQSGSQVEVKPGESPRIRVPDFANLTKDEIDQAVKSAGLTVSFEGEGVAVSQVPAANTLAPSDEPIQIKLEQKTD